MIVKRINRRKSRNANNRNVGGDLRTENMDNSMPKNNSSGSRFGSLANNNNEPLNDHVIQDSAIVPVHLNYTTQHVTIRVCNPSAEKNTQGGTRGKENRSNNSGQNKRILPKSIQKGVTAQKSLVTTNATLVRILKRDAPLDSGPTPAANKPTPTVQSSGPILTLIEGKEERAQEERRILERMRALTKSNPGLGFEDMFWDGSSTTRPPNKRLEPVHVNESDVIQHDEQEKMFLDPTPVQSGLSQPTPSSRC